MTLDQKLLSEIKDSASPAVYRDEPPLKPTATRKIVVVTACVVASLFLGVGCIFYVLAAPDATNPNEVKKR